MGMPPKPVVDETVNKILDRMDEDIATLYKITDRLSKALQTPREDDDLYDGLCLENVTRAINNLPERRKPIYTYTDPADKTQPVYVGEPEEVGAWELEQWAKESE